MTLYEVDYSQPLVDFRNFIFPRIFFILIFHLFYILSEYFVTI